MTEVLSTVLSPARVRSALRDACLYAELSEVPSSPHALRAFVEGPLFKTLVQRLDVSSALQINEQIRAAWAHAMAVEPGGRSGLNETQEVPRSLDAAPAREPRHPRVLVVTAASVVVFLLQDVLGDEVDVLPVSGAEELRDRLLRFGGQPLVVVVDRRHPSVDLDAAGPLRAAVGSDAIVMWWGADVAEQLEVEARLSGGPRYARTDPDLRLADLGELCVAAIEDVWG